ncbi:CLUMA_CG001310, isoform A [Clunio marinus]|uniref:CLUMA_CG001310, isoform A n=1 Tax=Clunio marinus TaxID=568069 RepID=A0A1J1HHM7_9DIPT|nr:CLUMA_CG001310, isoform A [Clunio marinus]
MDRNTRSIIPPMNHVKPRNGPISPRDRDMNNSSYSNHQPSHYNNYNNSSQNNSPNSQQHQHHPNSDLINFVSAAWKEKMYCEVFKPENAEKLSHFDLDGWFRTRQH